MKEELIEKYIRLIIEKGINIQPNQKLLIVCPVECMWFAHKLIKTAYLAGSGEVFIRWTDEMSDRLHYLYAPNNIFDNYPQWNKLMMNSLCEEKAAFLFIDASDPNALLGISEDRIQRSMKAAQTALKYYQDSLMANRSQWCFLSIPSVQWAQKVYPDLTVKDAVEKMWENVFFASHINENDPIVNWNKHIEKLLKYQDTLNNFNFKTLVYKNEIGTNLELELAQGHIWTGGSEKTLENNIEFIANIPTEEIFTTPKRDGVNGIVYVTKPLIYMGDIIEDIVFEFKYGRVINATARKNQRLLEKLISIAPNSEFLGEVALVPHDSPISKSEIVYYNSLYDENASCHLALGKAYPTTVKDTKNKSEEELVEMGINCSMEHIDFMIGSSDLNIKGITYSGEEIPVFVNGSFAF